MIEEADAEGELAESYRRYREPSGKVDNILKIHSLNPPSLEGHFVNRSPREGSPPFEP
jgi:hypothetical protein